MKLIDLLKLYNFRDYNENYSAHDDKHNTKIIRIYYYTNDSYVETCWFEFGVKDWNETTEEIIKSALDKKILESEVETITTSIETGTFEIYINRFGIK